MATFHCLQCQSIRPIIEEKEVKINRRLSVYLCKCCSENLDQTKVDQWKQVLSVNNHNKRQGPLLSNSCTVESN